MALRAACRGIVNIRHTHTHLATGSDGNSVRLWDLTTTTSLGTLPGHCEWVTAVAFSPDSKLLASGSIDRTARLWDPITRAPLGTLQGHSGRVGVVAFSPDGRRLASGSRDCTVRLWDPTTRALLLSLHGHSDWVTSVAFSLDGERLASGSNDRTVRLWDVKGTAADVLAIEHGAKRLSFPKDGRFLEAEKGNIKLDLVDKNDQHLTCSPSLWTVRKDWIVYSIQRLLWPPVEFRHGCVDYWGNSIAIGTLSGRVVVIQFDPQMLPTGKLPD